MQTPPPIFFFDDMAVGDFASGSYPKVDGDIEYGPFRGLGHLQLMAALKATGKADCYFKIEGRRVDFQVVGRPKYGILRIRGLG
jgi:hypothetical protein